MGTWTRSTKDLLSEKSKSNKIVLLEKVETNILEEPIFTQDMILNKKICMFQVIANFKMLLHENYEYVEITNS